MTKRKRSFSLMEVLIGFSLLSVLLVVLLSTFKDQLLLFQHQNKLETRTLHKVMLHDRLSKIFLEIPEKTGDFHTDNEDTELYFNMNNGPHDDPAFRGIVQARLYIDQEAKTLCLEMTGRGKSTEKQTLTLMEHVNHLQFAFLKAPGTEPTSSWEPNGTLPTAMRVSLDPENASAMYFILYQNPPCYNYPKEGTIS